MNETQFHELLLQALETELGGVEVYATALQCATDEGLRSEWEKYHEQTQRHVEIVEGVIRSYGWDPEEESPGRAVVRQIGESLVRAMEMAMSDAPESAAELVAAECVTLAETKDHLNWSLLAEVCKESSGSDENEELKAAVDEVEDQEDEHLYHTTGWTRELWIKSLELPSVLPPPEEQRDVRTEVEAGEAIEDRSEMLEDSESRS